MNENEAKLFDLNSQKKLLNANLSAYKKSLIQLENIINNLNIELKALESHQEQLNYAFLIDGKIIASDKYTELERQTKYCYEESLKLETIINNEIKKINNNINSINKEINLIV